MKIVNILKKSDLMHFLLIVIILIAYGSLYPLEFLNSPDFAVQIGKLTDFRFWKSGISDAIANVFLFVPFGMALQYTFKAPSRNTILGLLALTFIYAYFIQVLQIWTPERIPYGGDAIWNVFGSILGMMIFKSSGQYLTTIKIGRGWSRNLPLIVVSCFIIMDLQPLIPTFDLDTIKNNFKAVMSIQGLSILETVRHALFYFIPLTIWQLSLGKTKLGGKASGVLIAVIFLQLFIVNSGIDHNAIIGAFIAIFAFSLLSSTVTTKTLLTCITALIIFNALNTFEYRGSASFNWVPFKPALSGNTLVNIFALLEKSLFYCLFFYLSSREKIKFTKAFVSLSLIVFILEILQTNIKGATPDITENILVLFTAYVMWKWLYKNATEQTYKTDDHNFTNTTSSLLKDSRIRLFLFYLVLAVLAQTLFMRLPNLPYNIVEMYSNGGTLVEFTFLFLAIFVAIGGMVWIAEGHSTKNISNANLPLFCAYLSIATLLLLKMALTRESIADINGSSNITYQLTGLRILGDLGYRVVMFFGETSVRNVSQIIEPYIRFAALTGPIIYFLTLFLSLSYSLHSYKKIKFSSHGISFIKSFCFVLPWLFLCKLISFDFSSTDNLNELIARDGSWGIGGGGYLYMLLLTVALTVTYNVHSFNKKRIIPLFSALLLLILSVPSSWYLLKNGLVGSFEKYGYTFSGVDFLLGPSRSELLPESELIFRWGGVYLVVIAGLSLSILLAQKLLKNKTISKKKATIVINDIDQSFTIPKLEISMKKPLLLSLILIIGVVILINKNLIFNLPTNTSKQIKWALQDANILFDHHTHTKFSDGNLTVEEVVKLASANGCDAIAITDHTDSKRSLTKKQLDEIKLARLFNPNMLIVSGAELNPPSYKGREHINVLFTPNNEEQAFLALRNRIDDKDQKLNDIQLFELLNIFNSEKDNVVAIYNHPSRKDNDEKENKADFLKWSQDNDILIGLSGAPGHQKLADIGSYRGRFKTIDRWDPAIAKVGSTIDQLLDEGKDVWGAIASSDYHNEKMDYPPCGFSRIHVSAPEKTYEGLMTALREGTFWASHGKFLSQYKLIAEVSEKKLRLSPGEASVIKAGSIALIQVELLREHDYIGLPLDIELITNCVIGEPELLAPIRVPAFKNTAAALIPINREGKDGASCYLRSRVKVQTANGIPNMAYSNHIRFSLK
jgi:hypothetical protein